MRRSPIDAATETEFKALKASWLAAQQDTGEKITAGLAFTGDTAMGPILFDQSRLYPAGQSGEKAPPATPPAP